MDNSLGAVDAAEIEGTLVLVVEGRQENRVALARQLNALGYVTEVAVNGSEAFTKCARRQYGLVITACDLPRMNGYEFVSRLREREFFEGLPRVPVIACTDSAVEGDASLAAGMSDHVGQPIELAHLRGKLDRWLPLPTGRGDSATTLDGDSALLQHCLEIGDLIRAKQASLRIKDASRMLGADALAMVCEHIEQASVANDLRVAAAYGDAFAFEFARLQARTGSESP